MRAAIGLRLLLALTLMGWGQLAFSADYTWSATYDSFTRTGSSPSAACSASINAYNAYYNATNSLVSVTPVSGSTNSFTCKWADKNGYSGPAYGFLAIRSGDSCPTGDTYNPATGECSTPPVDCSNAKPVTAALDCTYSPELKTHVCPSVASVGGCGYVKTFDPFKCKVDFYGNNLALCAVNMVPTGQPSAPGDGGDLDDGTFTDTPQSGDSDQKCFDFGGKQLCLNPDNAGCDVYNGNPWCYQTGDNCGEVNGVFRCIPNTSRQCTYVNGKMECIDTGNPQGSKPPSYIPPTSSDHPYNGGNADGDDTNDPKAPGSGDDTQYVGGGGPPTDLSQTNDELRGLGDKLDKSKGVLEDIRDLLTGEGDDSGNSEGSAADAEAEGAVVGNAIGESITEHMAVVDEERNEEVESVLDELPNQVTQWFGADGSAVGLDFMDSILPAPVACSDYIVPLSLDGYTADVRLPVCALMPYKPILEWVIWCLTAIGAWRIGYSALRQEDSKAAKGGF